MKTTMRAAVVAWAALAAAGCAAPEGDGLRLTPFGQGAKVKFDMYHKPLPDVPLPNDFATRYDPGSPTKRRINASMEATTEWEKGARAAVDALDGWGTYAPISVGFDKPLDVLNLIRRHQGDDYDPSNDAVYVIDVSTDSPDFCQAQPMDMGEGNFPLVLERREYFPNDFHNDNEQLVFEEVEEDQNHNGVLDLGEDLDMDGVLDHPNLPFPDANRFQTMNFYERETNTLILKPVLPLRENTTYAVVLTNRLVDEDGRVVRSPFDYVNHTSQTPALRPLGGCLSRYGLSEADVAFAWTFSTQSVSRDFVAIRDGLYGIGPMERLATEFPADVKDLLPLRDDPSVYRRIVTGDYFYSAAKAVLEAQAGGKTTPATQAVADSQRAVDFHVVFEIESPQFFPRTDSEGNALPLYKQTWQVDPVTGAAFTRPEKVYVWLTVPKRRNGPAPVLVLGHGYTGNKLDPIVYGGFMARHGIATIGVECVSHGIGLDDTDTQIAKAILEGQGLGSMFDALVNHHRAFDQNGDGIADSAADFWTSYVFHTRDVVRQSAVDYMQLIRVLRSFDGVKRWSAKSWDANRDGQPDLAGDFDGDGVIDVGGNAPIHMTGGSLGGIMSTIMGGVEPQLETALPVAGGAGLSEVGVRSIQGGVGEAVNLRMLGPLMLTLKNATTGGLDVWQYLPNLNGLGKVKLGSVPDGVTLTVGDTAVVHNLKSGEHRCARVLANGLLRAAVSSDDQDPLRLEVYDGPLPPEARTGCRIPDDAQPKFVFDTLGIDVKFQGRSWPAGSPLLALGDGFGLRRQSPELRRFMGIAQIALEAGDPVNYAPNWERRTLRYGTGEVVRTRGIVINTIGDMNVPMATGAAIARAAGFIGLTDKDPRYGKSQNRLLIDTGALESVERTGRYQNAKGQDVLMDVDNIVQLAGANDGFDVPRYDPPLRLWGPSPRVGGVTGVMFPMAKDTGRHGFDSPDPGKSFDIGSFLLNAFARYVLTNGREFTLEPCMEDSSCAWIPPLPAPPP